MKGHIDGAFSALITTSTTSIGIITNQITMAHFGGTVVAKIV